MTSLKTVPSLFIMIGTIITILICFSLLGFIYGYPILREQLLYNDVKCIIINIGCVFSCGVLPLIIIIDAIHRGIYSVVTIDEKGMRRALFGVFRKVSISWDELKEMKCFYRVVGQIFCSKDISLKELTFNQITMKSKLIQIPASPKVLAVVRQYTDKEIIGLPEEKLQEMIEKYR